MEPRIDYLKSARGAYHAMLGMYRMRSLSTSEISSTRKSLLI